MKISELIEHLCAFDPDLPVFVDGYEGGYHEADPGLIRAAWVFPDRYLTDDEWYYGTHLESRPGAEGAEECLVIDRPDWRDGLHSPTKTFDVMGRTKHASA